MFFRVLFQFIFFFFRFGSKSKSATNLGRQGNFFASPMLKWSRVSCYLTAFTDCGEECTCTLYSAASLLLLAFSRLLIKFNCAWGFYENYIYLFLGHIINIHKWLLNGWIKNQFSYIKWILITVKGRLTCDKKQLQKSGREPKHKLIPHLTQLIEGNGTPL